MASAISYSVFCLWLPPELRFTPLFGRHVFYDVGSPLELLPYGAMAIVLVIAGVLYIKTFYGIHALFKRLPIVPHVRPMIGAVLPASWGWECFLGLVKTRMPSRCSAAATARSRRRWPAR